MTKTFPLRLSLLLLVLSVVTGCSSWQISGTDFFFTSLVPGTVGTTESNTEHFVITEPEEVLEEELSALNKTGAWEDGKFKEQTKAEPDVVYDFPITMNKQVEFYLDIFQNRQRNYFKGWLVKSGKYIPAIHQQLEKAGLPKDLAYLAMIESGFNPSAYSRAHAVGLWQFIKGTGRNYGLHIDSWIDERREPEKATLAAIAYLDTLYKEFGDWYLAVAAYNAGEGKIRKAIKRYKTRDFWQLASYKCLHLETKRYVPKLIAAIIIAKEPAKYGFTDINYLPPTPYDLVTVPPRTDIAAVAAAAKTENEVIRQLNNELRKNQTPPDISSYQIKVPQGSQEMVAANLKRLHPIITTDYKTHIVDQGDTLNRICRTYSLNKKTLLKANSLRKAKLRKGQHLRIPFRTTRYVLLKKGETISNRYAQAGKNNPLILHQLKSGETLSRLSKQYNVPVNIIMQWNDITDVNKVRTGQHIALYVEQDEPKKIVQAVVASKATKFFTLTDSKKSKQRQSVKAKRPVATQMTWYKVRHGDSIWTIAQKFQVSALDIRKWNKLPSDVIYPGKRLVIKKG